MEASVMIVCTPSHTQVSSYIFAKAHTESEIKCVCFEYLGSHKDVLLYQ